MKNKKRAKKKFPDYSKIEIELYCDGAYSSDKLKSAYGYHVKHNNEIILCGAGFYTSVLDSTYSEYRALFLSLKACRKRKAKKINIFVDNFSVVDVISGTGKTHGVYKKISDKIKSMLKSFDWKINHIHRSKNCISDGYCKYVMDRNIKKLEVDLGEEND